RPDAGRVRARARLAEQLAPDHVLVQRRAHPAGNLVLAGVLHEGEDDPAGDAVRGPADPGRRELLLDDQLLDRGRVPAPWPRPVRHHVAGLDQRLLPRLAVQRAQPGHIRLHGRPGWFRLGPYGDRGRPADATAGSA